MPLSPGSRVGSYEIVSMLGAGGMGEVYRARDTKLKREVAIKVLPDLLASDPDRLSRFQREAELLATLNHPNIAAIYGLEGADGAGAIVLELVEGETLAERIEKGLKAKGSGLPLDEAMPIARQIVDALEAAHDRGVVHRDLKPANIKVTPDGKVKVLDFGLAKMLEAEAQASSLSMSPTMSVHATYAGVILGTAAYMSPEQARGKPVDRRTDVWAFGCVVFEMLTGKRTFDPDGDTVSDAVAAVLTKEPDWSALPAGTPPHIAALLRRCLQKDPQKRLPHIGVARLEIDEGPSAAAPPAAAAPVHTPWRLVIPLATAVLLTAALAGGVWWRFKPAPPSPAITRFTITLPEGQNFTNTGRQVLALSSDGTQMVYVANQRLYLRAMSDVEARPIAGIDGGYPVVNPVFSPDGRSIVFYNPGENGLKRIAVTGGAAVTIGTVSSPLGVSWGADGILIGQGPRGVVRVSPNGGTPEVLVRVEPDEFAHGPQMLPGGKAVLFTLARVGTAVAGIAWDKAQVVVQTLATGARKTIVDGGSDARYLSTGHLMYAVSGVTFAVPFDAQRLQVSGDPVPIVEGVRRAEANTGTAQLSTSANGSLVYLPGPVVSETGSVELAIFDRKGGTERLKVPPAGIASPRISPDGTRVVFVIDDGKEAVVWMYELSGVTAMRRLTFGGSNRFPIWTADGQRVVFQSNRDGDLGLFWQRADGTGIAERLTTAEKGVVHLPESWSPKGEGFLFRVTKAAASTLSFYSLKDRKATPFGGVQSVAPTNAVFSPDGRWVAYEASAAGPGTAIYVQPFPATGAKYQVPAVEPGGYRHPRWSPDGKELFYMIGGNVRLRVSGVTTQPDFAFGNPMPVTKRDVWLDSGNDVARQFDIIPDGQRFIARIRAGSAGLSEDGVAQTRQIQVVLNWFEELKQRVPTK